ncbi:MAG: peptidylprolyl isomerase [Chlorobium sp.]|nr:MAG: peptidylprolyl isomerase [Chlorobium sp.]
MRPVKKIVRNTVFLCLASSFFPSTPIIAEVTDRLVAVVGNEAIFQSEIDNRALMVRLQYPEMAEEKSLPHSILDGLIDQKILLAKAKIDSVTIDLNSLDAMVKERFQQISSRFVSTSDMESRLGNSSAAIREDIRVELRNQQLIETLRKKKSAGVTITYEEVMAFYKQNQAQIPPVQEGVSVSQIIKYPSIAAESRARSLVRIKELSSQIKGGADFATLAVKYSEDPGSAKLGGDLGVARKGQFIPAFEKVAYALKEGEISDVVETRYGYHLIQLLSKEDNSIHVRHILVGLDRTQGDFSEAIQQLKEIYANVTSGKEAFADMAKKYSDDPASAALGGTLILPGSSTSTLSPSTLLPQLQKVIATLKKPGDISEPEKIEPAQGETFYAIFKLNKRIPAHTLDPDQDYSSLEELALENKNRLIFNQWVQQLRKEVYVRSSDI